ncbi:MULTISPECIES: alkene reductase [Burkholderia]|uniref:Alkene reductase n=1 Tax=Burkholderia contaminans TaxID=488447 RepID=A0A2S5E5N9_9BURK|nr:MULTISPECIES: alkene reductase [Burkholderia]EKS9796093.1 alkene reductase [Burkholderia cepacia]EKS9804859.1 alkene reductase [Burkholderia cepacia]EKS9811775.1 alkene reductase [Burkholderia cepacia]EKS9818903.1 alkene reductase [Burkholderia cepacia]EKS9826641.1 alkene reductase [Burkholderia cepacia]
MSQLFTPVRVGRYTLENRLVMAPMTRSRAAADGTPGEWAAEYYAQRSSLGLIVSEGTQPSDDGQGYLTTPGIHTDAHVAGWKAISDGVHARGGRLFIQLMHVGRMSHPDNTPHHRQGVAPSAIAPNAPMFTMKGMQDIPVPRALTTEEVRATVNDFRLAARRAIEAGADGVEIHGANGYLIQQFFAPNANTRTDAYGGSIENRARFAIEVATAIADEIGADRTAIRVSPGNTLGGLDEGEEGPDLYRHLATELDRLGLAYLHVMHQGNEALLADLRARWSGTLILNRPGRTRDAIGTDVTSGLADLEAYGQMVLANPDFVTRVKTGAPMNDARRETFFGGDARGYVDYPALDGAAAA